MIIDRFSYIRAVAEQNEFLGLAFDRKFGSKSPNYIGHFIAPRSLWRPFLKWDSALAGTTNLSKNGPRAGNVRPCVMLSRSQSLALITHVTWTPASSRGP